MNTNRGEAFSANIYQACNDEYKKGVLFNKEKLINSPYHSVEVKDDKLDVTVDRDAADIDDIFQSKGTAIPPDELLDMIKTSNIKIPLKNREDFSGDAKLPSSELLKVLHYYGSKKIASSPENRRLVRSLDETALLAVGMMVEQWMDDIIDETTAKLFTEDFDSLEEHGDSDEEEITSSDGTSDSSSNIDSSDLSD